MSNDGNLIKAAQELVRSMGAVADKHLPEKLAKIVKMHSMLAVGAAILPVPGADIAAATVNIWTMYWRINDELSLAFSRNLVKSIAIGVGTNIGGAVAGMVVLGSVFKFIPGIGTVAGAALIASTIYGITIVSGIVYMRAIAKVLGSSAPLNEANVKQAAEDVLKDRHEVKRQVKEARDAYKPDDKQE